MRVVARIAKNPKGYIVTPPARHMSASDFSTTCGASGFAGASAAGAAFWANEIPALANTNAAIDNTVNVFLFIYLFFVVYIK